MSKFLISTIIVILVITGAYVYFNNSAIAPENTASDSNPLPSVSPETPIGGINEPPSGSAKIFNVSGKSFSFDPAEIRVKTGDRVHINFSDTGGFHDLVIDGYNVRTERLNTGGQGSVDFVASTSGTFEFYCSVDGHRDSGMKGKLIVE